MKIQITKYASGDFNTPTLPGQMFQSKEELIKAVKLAWNGMQLSPTDTRNPNQDADAGNYVHSRDVVKDPRFKELTPEQQEYAKANSNWNWKSFLDEQKSKANDKQIGRTNYLG